MLKTIAGPFKTKKEAVETAEAIGANCSWYSRELKDPEGYGTGKDEYFLEQDDSLPSGKLFGYDTKEFMARQYKPRKSNPKARAMKTATKKKPSPAQLAARKAFAAAAKAGTLRKGSRVTAKRAPAKKRATNPVDKRHALRSGYVRKLKGFALYFMDSSPGKMTAWFDTQKRAEVAGQAFADYYGGQIGIAPMVIEVPDKKYE